MARKPKAKKGDPIEYEGHPGLILKTDGDSADLVVFDGDSNQVRWPKGVMLDEKDED